jgi:hypothetical protein
VAIDFSLVEKEYFPYDFEVNYSKSEGEVSFYNDGFKIGVNG